MAQARAIGNAASGKLPKGIRGCSLAQRNDGDSMSPKAEDVAVRVWFRLIRLESRMQAAITERLREIGLSVPQCDVLTTLTEAEGVSQQELAKRLYVTKGNISGLLDRLEAAGLVERRSTEADRRQYEIYLTPAGRAAAEKAIALQHAYIRGTLGELPYDDLMTLEELLIAIRDRTRVRTAVGSRQSAVGPVGLAGGLVGDSEGAGATAGLG
jgi:MarR family transcriptional regulator, organic hydroperoxide resistance regulator